MSTRWQRQWSEKLAGLSSGLAQRLLGRESRYLSPPPRKGQLELAIGRDVFPDRNAQKGGRSFYFFDFDDNVAFLATPILIFHKQTGSELRLSSGEFAQVHSHVGVQGPYADYRVITDDRTGSFRHFRDRDLGWLERLLGRRQIFVEDLAAALGQPDFQWKGPSWSCFHHATLNGRPTALITARGHRPETIQAGIRLLVDHQYIPHEPNYLSIFPVSHPQVRRLLGDDGLSMTVAALKKKAIRASVEEAIRVYGDSPFHRFGMSDDDPHNIELIVEEMKSLKVEHPEMSFFVIETQGGRFVKWEVYQDRTEATLCAKGQDIEVVEQLSLL